jgi:tripartite-type tricarboxylate transporter receptor subunit TctC
MRKIIAILLLATLLLLSLLVSSCTKTDDTLTPAEFYEGKTINMIVGGDAGSIADLVARVIATHLGADINGNVTVENRSEAGGFDGMNYLSEASPDGLTLGSCSMVKLLSGKILNDPAALYEIEDFTYILNINKNQTYFYVSATGPCQSVSDLKAGTGLKIAAGSASGYITLAGLSVVDLLDLDAKVVTGFENEPARLLATQRGEVIGYATSLTGLTGGELDKGTLKPLFVIATQRDPVRPDIPAITELVSLSEEGLALVKLWENGLASGSIMIAPAGIPDDNLDYMYELAEGWYQDESFQQDINQVSGYEVSYYASGESLAESIDDIAAALESFQARFAEMIEKYRL